MRRDSIGQRKIYWGFIALLIWALPVVGSAHPHVFVDNHLQLSFDSKGLTGVKVHWVFDEMFSSMALLDCGYDGVSLGRDQIAQIKQIYFDPLREFGYFFGIQINTTPFAVRYVRDFTVQLEGGVLIFSFFVPCHVTADMHGKTLRMVVEDFTNYTAITTRRQAVTLANEAKVYSTWLDMELADPFTRLFTPDALAGFTLHFRTP